MTTISSSNAEATNSSNEAHHPASLMGIMTPEKQIHELILRSDHWIRRDRSENMKLVLHRASLGSKLDEDSMEYKALHTLAMYPFKSMFKKSLARMPEFTREPVHQTLDNGDKVEIGSRITHRTSDTMAGSVFIPKNGRCPEDQCVSADHQCIHEMVNDGEFDKWKWGTRWWSDDVYDKEFGVDGNHLMCTPCIDSDSSHPAVEPVAQHSQQGSGGEALLNNQPSLPNPITPPIPQPRKSRQRAKGHENVTFKQLTNDFASLAEGVLKRDQRAARLLHGFICQAQIILSDSSKRQLSSEFLNLMADTKPDIEQLASVQAAPQLAEVSDPNQEDGTEAALFAQDPGPGKTSEAKKLAPTLPTKSEHPPPRAASEHLQPVVRPLGPGGRGTKRILSQGERPKKQKCSKPRGPQACGYCSKKSTE